MKFWLNVLVSLDQLANTLAGGNPDVTVSGHIGLMSDREIFTHGKWDRLAKMVDKTFAPIESNHCVESFLTDDDFDLTENFNRVFVIACLGCALLYLPIRIIAYATR
jgi:hypothetical protein